MKYLVLFLFMLMPLVATAQLDDTGLDTLYQQYITDDVKAQLKKHEDLRIRLEKEEQEREEHRMWWNLALVGCGICSLITTIGIFRAVFKGPVDAPLRNKIKAGAICLAGGITIFVIDALWLYLSFEATFQIKKLIICFILLALGIALWIYTKRLKTDNTDNV